MVAAHPSCYYHWRATFLDSTQFLLSSACNIQNWTEPVAIYLPKNRMWPCNSDLQRPVVDRPTRWHTDGRAPNTHRPPPSRRLVSINVHRPTKYSVQTADWTCLLTIRSSSQFHPDGRQSGGMNKSSQCSHPLIRTSAWQEHKDVHANAYIWHCTCCQGILWVFTSLARADLSWNGMSRARSELYCSYSTTATLYWLEHAHMKVSDCSQYHPVQNTADQIPGLPLRQCLLSILFSNDNTVVLVWKCNNGDALLNASIQQLCISAESVQVTWMHPSFQVHRYRHQPASMFGSLPFCDGTTNGTACHPSLTLMSQQC